MQRLFEQHAWSCSINPATAYTQASQATHLYDLSKGLAAYLGSQLNPPYTTSASSSLALTSMLASPGDGAMWDPATYFEVREML